ncbi:SipW-dependent-type signal peptide-containing protein [Rhodococcus sp. HNM0569]|uniref:SipW-dependent-type signal peptide-containing protein n=1 Tax=Rhodococcus sp. HNM0569 TaxID=2716340 RepID=UPI00146D11B6|nr:SipW-dependent-type signal peptide-containing protein [Rhodococcus sp. HNM0569]NLU84542.1 hypothetical protein [Rhodococcus sp. HNM0569]
MTTNDPVRDRKRRKRRALLASGLVLGVGAVITLAAWNDSVWGNSQFGTGDTTWNMQGTFDQGATWDEFASKDDGGTFLFTETALDLDPGDSTTAVVGVMETEGDLGATVTLMDPVLEPADSALAPYLEVTVLDRGTGEGPSDYNYGTVYEGTLAGATERNSTTVDPHGKRWYQFEVRLSQTAPQSVMGQDISAAWEFRAVSIDEP